jgi:hypothetical protein
MLDEARVSAAARSGVPVNRRRISWSPALRMSAAIFGSRARSSAPLTKMNRGLPRRVARSNSRSVGEMP